MNLKMVTKSVSVFVFLWLCGQLVNSVSAKTLMPSAIEPLPDLYSYASTYPVPNNVVNYNASPNPQYSSPQYSPPNYNNFNEHTTQPSNLHLLLPSITGSNQKIGYKQQQPSLEELVTGNGPSTKTDDLSNDLKNTLVSMKDNLGFLADTQRLLLNSLKVQQQQYSNIEEKLNAPSIERNAATYNSQQSYGVSPSANQQPQYQSIAPPLPPLPYGQPTRQEHHTVVHHHKKLSHKKLLGKLFKKNRKGKTRSLALLQRRAESDRLQRHAAMTLAYLRNGIVNALWTAAVVACVKLAPILLFGFKLMFKSVLPLTGLALFGTNRGLFPQYLKKDTDDDIQLDDIDDDDDDDDEFDEIEDDDDRDVSEEKDDISDRYR